MNVTDSIVAQIMGAFFLAWAAGHVVLVVRRLFAEVGSGLSSD